ncbi:Rubrerythrin [Desulfacinum hydrothermale DSM 13146]|uniref:Rubrerythrin n=1 Tax=Desulfacinum hydrothermale DSM 13146 TaxID=1121390 RepID=A0A1W1X9V1_9BACT|nr:ferritin family protein [Desulfacinum hydrothermale]SMC20716.1 Rubrerythrin [Desulfacinum hydrothermale DSM 13146]
MALSSQELLDAFCQAVEIKEKKQKLYQEAMEACSDAVGRETFQLLYESEKEHGRLVQEIYEELKAGKAWADACRYVPPEEDLLAKLLQKVGPEENKPADSCSDELAALETGIQLEEACIRLFEEKLEKATEPLQKEFLSRMSSEEREHRRILEDLKFYYTDPHGWFMEKSGARLDGAGPVT